MFSRFVGIAVVLGLAGSPSVFASDYSLTVDDATGGTEVTSVPFPPVSYEETSETEPAVLDEQDFTIARTSTGECGWVGQLEWLNWNARRQGLDYASFLDPVWLTPITTESLEYDRDSGLRVGLGYRFSNDWGVSWKYTYFHTDDAAGVNTAQRPGQTLNATRSFVDTAFNTVWADASLDYDVNDLEAGRWFSIDEAADLRLFGGFRWAMIDQELNQNYTYTAAGPVNVTGSIQNPTRMDAYGFRVGAEGRWTSCHNVSLFARGAGSVLVGKFDTRLVETNTLNGTIADFTDSYTQAVPTIEAAAGVAWQRGGWDLSGGYELTTWFNMAQVDRSSYDMILDGFFLRAAYAR